MQDLAEFFGAESPLQSLLPGYQPREGQAWMAEAVADALARDGKLVVEAGTGTGKTFAYLLPALMSGRKTIISTGTKALQDQLYHRDLPLIGKAVGRPVTTALLKGRANYLCLQRLDSVAGHSATGTQAADLKAVREWRHRTRSGDRAELTEVAEDSAVWPLVTSTVDNCLGSKCPAYQECHVVKARRAAQESDLVVVNHHLLLAGRKRVSLNSCPARRRSSSMKRTRFPTSRRSFSAYRWAAANSSGYSTNYAGPRCR
jgi:ATP-dependent DNA helicase DinG